MVGYTLTKPCYIVWGQPRKKNPVCKNITYLNSYLRTHLKDEGFLIDSCLSFLTGSRVALSSYGVSDKKDLVFLQLSER